MKLNINGTIIEVEDSVLSEAIEKKTETLEVKSEDVVMKSKTDFDSYTTNIQTEAKAVGIEIGHKEILKGVGIDEEALHKDLDKSIAAINTLKQSEIDKALEDSGAEPDKKIKELQIDLEALRNKNTEWETKFSSKETEFSNYKKDITKSNKLRSLLPDNLALPIDKTLLLIKNDLNLDIDEHGNLFGIGNDGQPIKDANRNLMPAKDVLISFFNDNSYLLNGSSGGAGGSDSNGSSNKMTMNEFISAQKEKGVAQGSEEFNTALYAAHDAGSIEE